MIKEKIGMSIMDIDQTFERASSPKVTDATMLVATHLDDDARLKNLLQNLFTHAILHPLGRPLIPPIDPMGPMLT